MPIPSRFTEAGTQMTSAPHSRSDRYWKPRFRASAEDRVHAYCARPDWHTVNRGPSLRLSADGFFGQNTNLPFADVKSHGPDLLTHPSHYQPPCVSHEQSKYATTAHPTLSFQRHPGHTGIIEALGPTGAQASPGDREHAGFRARFRGVALRSRWLRENIWAKARTSKTCASEAWDSAHMSILPCRMESCGPDKKASRNSSSGPLHRGRTARDRAFVGPEEHDLVSQEVWNDHVPQP
ncbi:hypothetical protein F5148DRAFT_493843 [Russula earlei]|uniref:Uncharacterized protein n=1 Tax=Russula earlei TaxID=71964 RepID=A0ACC0TYQ9_9AGAM|nr:hypothetical protein F5148DRAFT_493843 [Russula earlei]